LFEQQPRQCGALFLFLFLTTQLNDASRVRDRIYLDGLSHEFTPEGTWRVG
jgi:hypothetical protein